MRNLIKNCIPYAIIGVISIMLLIRCFYSFSWSDESFYLTIVHRFWLGEQIIADEWYTTQLSSQLLLPFYALFQWITNGNECVYLYFRILYWLIAVMTAFFTYRTLKNDNSVSASLLCALLYLVYSRANIGGMSYYNMTLTCTLLSVLLIYGQISVGKNVNWKFYLIGILLAFAVVFTPFLAIPYLVVMIIFLFYKKCRIFRRSVLWSIAGTATAAVIYVWSVLCKITIDDLILNIPHILNEPELQETNILLAVPIMAARIVWRYRWTAGLIAGLFSFIIYKKKRKEYFSKRLMFLIALFSLGVFLINSYLSWGLIGCINIAGVLSLIPLLLISERWKTLDKKILMIFGTAGFSLSVAFSFSSDTGLDAMAVGFVLLGMGTILLAFKMQNFQKVTMFIACVMVIQTMALRIFSIYRDAPIDDLNVQILSGPAKYLYTTQEHAEQYEALEKAINEYVRPDDIVFYSKECFWSYLVTENHYGVPSSWRMAFDSPRLEEYYTLYPQKIPTCIFVLNPVYGNYESSLIQGNEKAERPNENRMGGYLAAYIKEYGYEKIEIECATIYRKVD